MKAHARFHPVFLRVGNPEFELSAWNTSRHNRAPIVLGAEPEFVLGAFDRFSRRALCPPGVETRRRRDSLKHLLRRRFDGEVMNYVGHFSSFIAGPHCLA